MEQAHRFMLDAAMAEEEAMVEEEMAEEEPMVEEEMDPKYSMCYPHGGEGLVNVETCKANIDKVHEIAYQIEGLDAEMILEQCGLCMMKNAPQILMGMGVEPEDVETELTNMCTTPFLDLGEGPLSCEDLTQMFM